MTRRRSLKRRIRARMKRTGESYTTARRHVTSRLENESGPAEVAPASAQERRRWRGPVMMAAVGLALVGAVVAVIAIGRGGNEDAADRYARSNATRQSGLPPSVERVSCSEMIRPAQLASDRPEQCFRLHPAARSFAQGREVLRKRCHLTRRPRLREGGCAFGLPIDQREVVVRGAARPSERSLRQLETPTG
jgi:hypothetical protein